MKRSTGLLVVEAGDTKREVYFRNGAIIQASSMLAEEALGAVLVRMEVITEQERDSVLEQAASEERVIGDVLIGIGLMTPMGVMQALTDQARIRVLNCMRLKEYSWNFHEKVGPTTKFQVNLSVPFLLFGSVAEAISAERMVAHMGLNAASVLSLKVPLGDALVGLDAGPRYTRIVRGLQDRPFFQIAREDPEKEALLSLVYTMWSLNRLEVKSQPVSKESELELDLPPDEQNSAVKSDNLEGDFELDLPGTDPAADPLELADSKVNPARDLQGRYSLQRKRLVQHTRRHTPIGTPATEGVGQLEPFQAVVQLWLKADQLDYYQLLGVSRDAGPSDVTIAYGALLRRLKLEKPPEDWPNEAKQAAVGLLARVGLAFAVLTDTKERSEYKDHVQGGGGEFIPKNEMLVVGAALRTSDRLRSLGRYKEAVIQLRDAAQKFPKEPAIHLLLGRVYFEWTTKGEGQKEGEAAHAFTDAARLDPALDEPWVFLGLLARSRGENRSAIEMYRKALTVNPKNERAKKELSSLEPKSGFLSRLFKK